MPKDDFRNGTNKKYKNNTELFECKQLLLRIEFVVDQLHYANRIDFNEILCVRFWWTRSLNITQCEAKRTQAILLNVGIKLFGPFAHSRCDGFSLCFETLFNSQAPPNTRIVCWCCCHCRRSFVSVFCSNRVFFRTDTAAADASFGIGYYDAVALSTFSQCTASSLCTSLAFYICWGRWEHQRTHARIHLMLIDANDCKQIAFIHTNHTASHTERIPCEKSDSQRKIAPLCVWYYRDFVFF